VTEKPPFVRQRRPDDPEQKVLGVLLDNDLFLRATLSTQSKLSLEHVGDNLAVGVRS